MPVAAISNGCTTKIECKRLTVTTAPGGALNVEADGGPTHGGNGRLLLPSNMDV